MTKKLARRRPCWGSSPEAVAQVEQHLAALAGGLELGGDLVHAGLGERAGLEVEDGRVLVLLLGKGRRRGDGPGEGQLVGVGLARADHREGDGGSRLAFEHETNHRQRQLACGLPADGLNDVAVGQVLLVGRRTGQ